MTKMKSISLLPFVVVHVIRQGVRGIDSFILHSSTLGPREFLSNLLLQRELHTGRLHSLSSTSSSSLSSLVSSWSTTDDWESLSSENPQNGIQSGDVYNQHFVDKAAWAVEAERMMMPEETIDLENMASLPVAYSTATAEQNPSSTQETSEFVWLKETVDQIYNGPQVLYDKDGDDINESLEQHSSNVFEENEMGEEISLMIRCNEDPTQLLIHSGRALPPLTESERSHLSQLLDETTFAPTHFLRESVNVIFQTHADSATCQMTRKHVAQWFSSCTGQTVGQHDARVQSILSKYSNYGTGFLTRDNFQQLYFIALVGDHRSPSASLSSSASTIQTLSQLQKVRKEPISAVWRDIRNHGIFSPVEQERNVLLEQFLNEQLKHDVVAADMTSMTSAGTMTTLLDECELVSEDLIPIGTSPSNSQSSPLATANSEGRQRRRSRNPKSSHELVELAHDGKTPLWMQDGDFVFIDEQSCIGCAQCTLAAPGSFYMTDQDGRARAFCQSNSRDVAVAVSTCPVDCMHYVSFRELKRLELARDFGVGQQDHQHFGLSESRGYFIPLTPLHVSGRASDSNHKSSWYHHLRSMCYKSKDCPQRGCFDCPMYQSNPYNNPFFQEQQQKANSVRAEYFIQTGVADSFRTAAEL